MMESNASYLVSESIVQVEASSDRVWEVLTRTDHVREWDDVPTTFSEPSLSLGSILEWAGSAQLTVTQFDPGKCLRYSYHHPQWPRSVDGIDYLYLIRSLGDSSELTIRVGDWSAAPDGKGQAYHEASIDFVAEAAEKIKQIAER